MTLCRFGQSPQSVDDILTYVVREFGPIGLRPVHKGENVGWFIDQMMISLLVASFANNNSTSSSSSAVKFVARNVGVDRVDRNSWDQGAQLTVDDKIDAHLLENAYLPHVWVRLIPLIRVLHGFETSRYEWCMHYYDNFQKLFLSYYRGDT